MEEDTGNSDTRYEDPGVELETKYMYRVKARNSQGLNEISRVAITTAPADPTPPSAAPIGLPTTIATAQVGETLSAVTSGISDANGITNVQFTY